MSKLITNTIRHTGASSDALTLDSSGNTTAEGNLTVDGTSTLTGNVTASGTLTASNFSGKNLIINGGMAVAQRGTTSTGDDYTTVDRFRVSSGGHDEAPTKAQVALTSSDAGPWEKGFRYALQITNGNQTSGAQTGDYSYISYRPEAQDIAQSGWNYNSASSYLTLSFWVKSSVAQNFYGYMTSEDGTKQSFPFETGSLSANTWKKVTVKIPGHANITLNNDNGAGLDINLWPFLGTDYTASGVSLNAWAAYASASRTPDFTSTWWTTNDATFSLTGVQLEVGDVATEFEHRSYGDELARCQRYLQVFGNDGKFYTSGATDGNSNGRMGINLGCPLRASPTVKTGGSTIRMFLHDDYKETTSTPSIMNFAPNSNQVALQVGGYSGLTSGRVATFMYKDENKNIYFSGDDKNLALEAEL